MNIPALNRCFLVLVLWALGSQPSWAQSYTESRYLAVLEVETSAEIFEEIGVDVLKLIAEEMRNGARMTTRAAEIKWVIMTTDSLPEIMRRQNLDPEACDEADCAVQTGQAIGANLLVETHLAKSGGRWLLKVTLHDVDSAGFRGSEHILHQGDIWDMIEAAGQLNRGLLRQYMTPEELAENRMPQVSQTAQLTVKSIRGAIPVLVNGEPRGNTPLQLDLSSGRHYIQVAPSSCWEGPQVEVNLRPNEQKTRYLNPVARDVTVEISAVDRRGNAIAAAVAVDGERLGTTPDRFKVSACAQELVTTYVGKTKTTNLEQYLKKRSSGVPRIQVKHFTRGPSRSTQPARNRASVSRIQAKDVRTFGLYSAGAGVVLVGTTALWHTANRYSYVSQGGWDSAVAINSLGWVLLVTGGIEVLGAKLLPTAGMPGGQLYRRF